MGISEIVHDHAEIERAAGELRRLVADEGTELNAVSDAVSEFQRAMEQHFENEEKELFPKLRDVAPDLVFEIDDLERQHAEMRDAVTNIRAALSHDRAAAAAAIEQFWTELDAHAEREASIVSVTRDAAYPGDVMGG
jgi:iron-sulfur cluster repair protein YtfE (RIC family)